MTRCWGSCASCWKTDGFFRADVPERHGAAQCDKPAGADCYVIDYKMPDKTASNWPVACANSTASPVILITGYSRGNISARAAAAQASKT